MKVSNDEYQVNASTTQHRKMQGYYKLHAKIYDMTRWGFLFGRDTLIEKTKGKINPKKVLEIGCGTGKNLIKIANSFQNSRIYGLDVSPEMLKITQKKLDDTGIKAELIEKPYTSPLSKDSDGFDLIVFSYCLSMINPGWEEAIANAQKDLSDNGIIAVVDFHYSKYDFFRKWMNCNHVKMKSHLLPELEKNFRTEICKISRAYLGLWEYLIFIGSKKS